MNTAKLVRKEIKELKERIEDLKPKLAFYKELERAISCKQQSDLKWRIEDKIKSGEGFTTIKGFCIYHGICNATVYNWVNKGLIPRPIKIRGRFKGFKNSDLLAILKRVDKREIKATKFSPKSKFAKADQRRITANLDAASFEKLRTAAATKRKPAGKIIDELIENYIHKIKEDRSAGVANEAKRYR